uniref:Leucine-rich repeat-containing protein 57 n=1 Tax=Rhabditophanes sp. KR3021 TaxID=114890 RepID=A0AC35TX22_9BILA
MTKKCGYQMMVEITQLIEEVIKITWKQLYYCARQANSAYALKCGSAFQTKKKPELLKHLDASKNLLKSVPITISKFTNMKQLILNQNAITEIPEEIGLCKNLVQLELSENLLIDLPMNIKMLEKLTTIVLSKNAFQAYPIALCLLQHLDVANLSDNQITELPADIGNSSCIEINLDNNKLEKLNDNIANCKRLKVLRLNHNCLTVEVFTKQLMENSPVCKIYFEGNYFEEKQFQQLPGYNQYEQRYTANVNKVN